MSKTTSVVGGKFPCPVKGCGKAFNQKSGLVMHNNRVHLKTVKVPGEVPGQDWRNRRENLRNSMGPDKYDTVMQLLNSEKDRARARKNASNARTRLRNLAKGLTSAGKPRKRPFNRNLFSSQDVLGGLPVTKRKTKRKKIQYVYPVTNADKLDLPEPLTLDSGRSEIINKIVDTYIDRYLR